MLPMGKEKNSYLPELTHNLSQEKIGPEGNHSPCVTFFRKVSPYRKKIILMVKRL